MGGFAVYASARRLDAIADLEAEGCNLVTLDVTDDASRVAAVKHIEREQGAVWGLVNNAGYSQSGPLEQLPLDLVRRQFETNVFGALRLAQLVLPGMRRLGDGRVVNVSSMGGRLTFPGAGAYHASKFALEALSDVLRFEVAGFGVAVVVIEPGLIRTGFGEAAVASLDGRDTDGPYGGFTAAVATATREVYERGPLARLGGGPETVAAVVAEALRSPRPRTRYRVTPSARLLLGVRRLLPDRAWDSFLATRFPRPGTQS